LDVCEKYEKLRRLVGPYVLQKNNIQKRFEISKELGKGSYGRVFLSKSIPFLQNNVNINLELPTVNFAVKKIDINMINESFQSMEHIK
jgi:hypothetical protein